MVGSFLRTLMLQLHLLGSPQIILNDTVVRELTSLKSQAILFYLATKGRSLSRLALGGLLWPHKSDGDARMNLRQAVRHLRLALGDYVVGTRETLALNPSLPLAVDVLSFERLAHAGLSGEMDALRRAADLYNGDFLTGFYVEDVLEFESWILLERERLRNLALQVLQQLAGRYAEEGEIASALQASSRLLALEPWHEATYRQMMRLLAGEGQISAALAQYETCRQVLAAELGAEPSDETTALYEQIRQGTLVAGPSPARTPAARLHHPAPGPVPHNLPRQFTEFVGRQENVRHLEGWLEQPSCALITILGPGGIGKTRLAVEVAHRSLSRFPDGAWFVDLSAVDRPENLFSAIAAGLNLNLSGRSEVKMQVLQYLQERHLLLVMDNFEHLLAANAELLQILHRARYAQIVVTSRVSLQLQAEWLFHLEGLAVPDASEPDPAAAPSVRLFLQRMQTSSNRSPTPEDVASIGHICRLVEGMPLAIEIAASLARTRTVDEIAEAIARDADILATTFADVPARQRSLRAVFDYSWELLSPQEQAALAGLSVFRGGFTAIAASAVASASDTMLLALQNKSLLQQPISGRYRIHQLLAQYVAEKLTRPAEAGEVQRRHTAFYLAFVGERQDALWQPGAQLALTEIRRNWGNINKAWQVALDRLDLAALEQSECGLIRYHLRTGLLREGASFFGQTAAQLQEAFTSGNRSRPLQRVLGRLLANQARLLVAQAEYEQGVEVVHRALAHAGDVGDRRALANTYLAWSTALSQQGELDDAQAWLEQALEEAQAAGIPELEGTVLSSMGVLYFHRGRHTVAAEYLRRAEAAYEGTSDYGGKAQVHNNLASIAVRTGDYAGAKRDYEVALQVYRDIGEYGGEALVLGNLGIVASHVGQFGEATRLIERALIMCREARIRRVECALLNTRGAIQLRQGDLQGAEAYLQQALEMARVIGNQYTESETLSNFSLLALYRGHEEEALATAQEALRTAERAGEHTLSGFAWMALGRAREALGENEVAGEAYATAYRLRQALAHQGLILEAQAGQARAALHRRQPARAQEIIVAIWPQLAPADSEKMNGAVLHGAEEPCRVLLTCYHVFSANDDPRAQTALERAANCLQEWATYIGEEQLRRSFLEEVPAHRELRSALSVT